MSSSCCARAGVYIHRVAAADAAPRRVRRERVAEEEDAVDLAQADHAADLLVATERAAARLVLHRKAEGVLEDRARRARRDDGEERDDVDVLLDELLHRRLRVVVRDDGEVAVVPANRGGSRVARRVAARPARVCGWTVSSPSSAGAVEVVVATENCVIAAEMAVVAAALSSSARAVSCAAAAARRAAAKAARSPRPAAASAATCAGPRSRRSSATAPASLAPSAEPSGKASSRKVGAAIQRSSSAACAGGVASRRGPRGRVVGEHGA